MIILLTIYIIIGIIVSFACLNTIFIERDEAVSLWVKIPAVIIVFLLVTATWPIWVGTFLSRYI